MSDGSSVLDDLTVIDISEGIAGSYCTKLLAALGARVIKVEPPGGGALRRLGPFAADSPDPERSGPFLCLNTSKQGVTLNLDSSDGRAILIELAARADVLVEDSPPGTLAQRGIDYAALSSRNPRLIMVSITPFGQDGPYRDYLANEIVVEALGGLMYPVGNPDREPLKIGGNAALHSAGGAAFSAAMATLWMRDETGKGSYVDLSIQETTAVTQIHSSVRADWAHYSPGRRPSSLLPAADGYASAGLEIGVAADTWPRLCEIMGRPDLAADDRFATALARRHNREAMAEEVSHWVRSQPKERVYHVLQGLRSIAGYVADAADLHRSEQLLARHYFQEIDHPVVGPARYPAIPFRFDTEPLPEGRAPLLGEHNYLIYGEEMRMARSELDRLEALGVI